MSRRIPLGKLRNPSSNILSTEYDDDEERVKMLMTSKAGSSVIPDIVPESRESYDHRIAFQREDSELLKRANLECYYIDYLLKELESDVRPSLFRKSGVLHTEEYYKYFELGKSLLNAVNNQDYTAMSNILQEWDNAKRTPFVAQLLANSAYKRSRTNVSVPIPPAEIDVSEEYDSNIDDMKALNLDSDNEESSYEESSYEEDEGESKEDDEIDLENETEVRLLDDEDR